MLYYFCYLLLKLFCLILNLPFSLEVQGVYPAYCVFFRGKLTSKKYTICWVDKKKSWIIYLFLLYLTTFTQLRWQNKKHRYCLPLRDTSSCAVKHC
jgi:hypothetical protein